jgi:hypothetical protein
MDSTARELQLRLVQAMTAEQKLLASQSLRELAWGLKAAWIRSRQPELSEAEVQETVRRLFRNAGA